LALPGALTGSNLAIAEGLNLGGFVQVHGAMRSKNVDCPPGTKCSVPFNDQRMQLKAEGSNKTGSWAFLGKVDLIHDSALNETSHDVRELYLDYNAENFTLRGGRQIVTWGVSDLLFINDTFPKDWVAFYSGQPLEYLKRGNDAVKLNMYSEFADLEVVLSRFRKDILPDRQQFVMDTPFPSTLPLNTSEPSDPEISVRLSRYLGSWDGALYFSRTHYHAPAMRLSGGTVQAGFPRLNSVGASLSGPLWNGVLNLEAGHYESRDDLDGTDPSIENNQTRFLMGYTRQVGSDTTIGVQAYAEWMRDYSAYKRNLPAGFPQRDEVRTVATMRFTQSYLHQTLNFNLFAFIGLSDDDSYVIPSIRYAFSDNLWGEVGANIFSGSRDGMFGALGDNDNVYLSVRYAF